MVHHEALLQSILGNARLSSAHMQIFDLDAKSIGLVRELLEEARLMHVDAHTDCLATSLVHTPTTSMVKKVIAGVCDISTAQPSPVGIVRTSTGLSTTSSLTCVGSTPSALRVGSTTPANLPSASHQRATYSTWLQKVACSRPLSKQVHGVEPRVCMRLDGI
jgi:hypothetical protein